MQNKTKSSTGFLPFAMTLLLFALQNTESVAATETLAEVPEHVLRGLPEEVRLLPSAVDKTRIGEYSHCWSRAAKKRQLSEGAGIIIGRHYAKKGKIDPHLKDYVVCMYFLHKNPGWMWVIERKPASTCISLVLSLVLCASVPSSASPWASSHSVGGFL